MEVLTHPHLGSDQQQEGTHLEACSICTPFPQRNFSIKGNSSILVLTSCGSRWCMVFGERGHHVISNPDVHSLPGVLH